jgi:triosephosphate isomerase
MRRPIIAGNWKMHLGRHDEALPFVRSIRHALNAIEDVDRVLCPPFTALAAVSEALAATNIGVGAQNMHWDDSGAQTGEISPSMLTEHCQFVILGHSERRASGGAGESDQAIEKKLKAALAIGLSPILCVGEDLAQNEAGQTQEFVSAQVHSALATLNAEEVRKCVIAYEPIWAIGTGKSATPADANRIIGLTIRGTVAEMFDGTLADALRVQYGGSVNIDNINAFMAMPEIDGALVGGASLKPDFVELVKRAAATG